MSTNRRLSPVGHGHTTGTGHGPGPGQINPINSRTKSILAHNLGHVPQLPQAKPSTSPSINQITPNLFIGDAVSSISVPTLISNGITAMVSCVHTPFPEWEHPAIRKLIPAERHFKFIPCDDSPTQDLLGRLDEVCDFIDKMMRPPSVDEILAQMEQDGGMGGYSKGVDEVRGRGSGDMAGGFGEPGKVLVHCNAGVSRSGTVVVAYLMRKEGKRLKAALREVRRKRRVVDPSENFIEQLRIWEECQFGVWEDVDEGCKDGEGCDDEGKRDKKRVPKEPYQRWLDRRDEVFHEQADHNPDRRWILEDAPVEDRDGVYI